MKGKDLLTGSGRGFTIVELLVVTVALAILCAIAFPVFTKTKETARTSECLSNMRQIGIALRLYLDDHADRFPSAVEYGSPDYWKNTDKDNIRLTMQELLQPYVNSGMVYDVRNGDKVYVSAGVFQCPSDMGVTRDDLIRNGVIKGVPVWKTTGSSYRFLASSQEDWDHSNVVVPMTALSPLLASASGKARVGAPYKAIAYPTKKAVVADLWFWHMGDQTPDNRLAYTNTLFADGHADRIRGGEHLEARLQQLNRWHSCTEISSEQ